MLQRFGTARALHLLERLRPVLVTSRVRKEQHRTAPDHSREQFRRAASDGWIRVVRGAHPRAIGTIQQEFSALSDADAELLVVAARQGLDLFTDDRLLIRAARARGVTAYDAVDTISILEGLAALDRRGVQDLVLAMAPDRTFTKDDLDLLGLRGRL